MIIKFGNTLINVAEIEYARIKKDETRNQMGYVVMVWRLYIYFRSGKHLSWTYDSEDEAKDGLDRLHQQTNTYMIGELP